MAGSNLILKGTFLYRRTSGQSFCHRTKVWPFRSSALNVSVEPDEWAM